MRARTDPDPYPLPPPLVFPGGFLPSFHYMTESMEKGSKSQLIMDDVVNIGVSRPSLSPFPFPPAPHTHPTLPLSFPSPPLVPSLLFPQPHYARTLREWSTRFQALFPSAITSALLSDHPEMSKEDIEVFRRKWLYYFQYCAAGFTERILGVHIFRVTKEGNRALGVDLFA